VIDDNALSGRPSPHFEQATTDPNHELKQRLEVAKLERARLAAEREAREEARALAEQLEAEELAVRNAQAIEKAESEHGPLGKKIAAMHTTSGIVILKRPNHVIFKRFQERSMSDKGLKIDECEALVRPSLVHPDKATFERYAEEEPAIILRAANVCAALAGSRAEEVSGK
jgi:hypothetical protein